MTAYARIYQSLHPRPVPLRPARPRCPAIRVFRFRDYREAMNILGYSAIERATDSAISRSSIKASRKTRVTPSLGQGISLFAILADATRAQLMVQHIVELSRYPYADYVASTSD